MNKKNDPLALDPGSPENPAIFGKYLLLGLVARGGMAEVYRAKKMDDTKMIALKCMRTRLSQEQKYIDMFLAEGKLASLFTHENIVETWEGGRYENAYYFTMEYIHGKDLNHILRKIQITGSRMPIPVALSITAKALRALDYAHNLTNEEGEKLNIVNRDVSPSNIRISYDGKVKIIDFGIAKTKARFTSEIGTLKGKFSYMSPEQIRGLPLDGRTDIFSIGIILYEMLTMERLFKAESETVLMEKVRKAEINPPSSINSRINEKLDKVVLKALHRDRENRYQTASDFADAIEEILEPYKYKDAELANLMKRIFADEYKKEKDIQTLVESMEIRKESLNSVKHESFDTIINQDFSLGKAMEFEFEMDDGEEEESEPVHTQDLLDIAGNKKNNEDDAKSEDLMKYIYILLGLTLFIIIVIIVIITIK